MLKRIKYASRFARPMSQADIDELALQCVRNNTEKEITGVLMTSGDLFFQVLEGPPDAVDSTLEKIVQDPRHTDVLVLAEELSIRERLFPQWSMLTITLNQSRIDRLEPLRTIMEIIIEQRASIKRLTHVVERAVWAELVYNAERAAKSMKPKSER